LRELASQIDLRRREPIEEEGYLTPDQVMVCLSSAGPNSEMLLRYASRLAGKLNRNWYALYVQTPSEEPTAIDAETQRVLSTTLTLAKQLGAMVFTYKGEDIADTILRFAREYRVGHIVVGSPARRRFWQRFQGRQSIVEKLVDNADGITMVILDTKKGTSSFVAPEPEPAKRQVGGIAVAPTLPALSGLLSTDRILVWDEPLLKEEVLNALAQAALTTDEKGKLSEISRKLWEREQQGSTFFNEGVAFPHARIDGLQEARVALGLTHHGIADVATDKPIEAVFLILTPAESANAQLQTLALTSKAAQNRHLLQRLKLAKTPTQALASIEEWEEASKESSSV
jgi:two-component system sensor histidine kinase KdpD